MAGPVDTGLWHRSLGHEFPSSDAEQFRRRLITALELFHERAELLAKEIVRDLPDFTVHDESHFDSLWGLADRIAGPDLELNPAEAFVFGGACLIHDLGMASAAYVEGLESLQGEPRWSDTVALILRRALGRVPTREEVGAPDDDVVRAAREQVLRELHAEHAERLATATWSGPDGAQYALIEDALLRETYGAIVGQIARSHWWGTSSLGERFTHALGAPAGCPPTWTVRPLIVACLLRLADASHLDASRAPRFLRAVRRLAAAAAPHWEFQARLSQPYTEADRFVFTGSPFPMDEAEAWWLCADTLKMVDQEFRAVDALLADRKQPRLAIRGVAGADDLGRLAEYVPTQGWTPLDARVRVSDVVRLVERMGGRELYGSTPHVPLRELVQNASDAVRARRAIERRGAEWGDIVVRLGGAEAGGRRWLEVEDTGVGMSRTVLTRHLLDFGTSFWESEHVLEELPGLLAAGFEPTGRFGIGFFSVFMWGDEVTVTSRRNDASQSDTHVLEFTGGVSRRPRLRVAKPAERMVEPGTRVRVLLAEDVLWRFGIDDATPVISALAKLCAWLAPALDVNLHAECDGERLTAVEASDWIRLPIDELGNRLRDSPIRFGERPEPGDEKDADAEEEAEEEAEEAAIDEFMSVPPALAENARLLKLSDGSVVGRALLNPMDYGGGVVVVGGFRSTNLRDMTGVLVGRATTASRHVGIPLVSAEVLAEWASEQATLVAPALHGERLLEAAACVHMCRGDTGPLPIAVTPKGMLARSDVSDWASALDEILVVQDAALTNDERAYGEVELNENVAVTAMTAYGLLTEDPTNRMTYLTEMWPATVTDVLPDGIPSDTLLGALAEAVREAWDVPREELSSIFGPDGSQVIGGRDGAEVALYATVLRRPVPDGHDRSD